ncbi:HAD-IIB family hydrolase [Vibrio sp. La 4.2.2]|uniref:HAD-IIB family hydrolase n=1 Tax=Vibrio sp. La 4.2.2 TaxID=2998830 RepID=UPI0022CDE4CC|nr:HAD-IIB family hydrolase [Vibrio sp. La 4.2.2]MDA0108049.1 HAD-IIB family hydrolase [Vibrio sp. La 4.2.2]
MPKSLSALSPHQARKIEWLFTDVDDTLTWEGALPPETLLALNKLRSSGVKVVAVTGACAGWCDQIAKLWPVHGVIGENGAFWMMKNQQGFHVHSLQPMDEMRSNQKILLQRLETLLVHYPGIEFANDQSYRFCDVAINLGQDREPVADDVSTRLLNEIRSLVVNGQKVKATQSSIHINVWLGEHSKRFSSEEYLKVSGNQNVFALETLTYIGDSLNDESMFDWLPITFGVNNLTPLLSKLRAKPSYITSANGGYGFAELAQQLVEARHSA